MVHMDKGITWFLTRLNFHVIYSQIQRSLKNPYEFVQVFVLQKRFTVVKIISDYETFPCSGVMHAYSICAKLRNLFFFQQCVLDD